RLMIDGTPPEKIREICAIDMYFYEMQQRNAAKIWDAAGGYAPTIGILGAVLGLIHVMENLSDPSRLGGGIAVAFVATIYGVGLANLVFLPIAGKLKGLIQQEVMRREMLLNAWVSIASGDHPRIVEERLIAYLR
ncbi:MAG TPA: MotA/TolQ/ExbB proton channel family protein, partial [Methylophilus sp.]|nr:MotA/TolQ/ExbB proton channel family protein [Methylophilus sp.]